MVTLLNGLAYNFLHVAPISDTFPYFNYSGFFSDVAEKVRKAIMFQRF